MNRRTISRSRNVTAVCVLGMILLAALALPAGAARWLSAARGELGQPALAATATPASDTDVMYAGTVKLEWAMPGEFGEPLPTPTPNPDPQAAPPPDLGAIDLGFQLVRSGNTMSGHVDLDATLVFTGTLEKPGVGPAVTGTFDGTNLTLTSERVDASSAGQSLMRQFRLTGAVVSDEAGTLRGQYRETIWGYGPRPLTVIGTFTLREGTSGPNELNRSVYLPLVLRQR